MIDIYVKSLADDLKKMVANLEEKVSVQTSLIIRQSDILDRQNKMIGDILDKIQTFNDSGVVSGGSCSGSDDERSSGESSFCWNSKGAVAGTRRRLAYKSAMPPFARYSANLLRKSSGAIANEDQDQLYSNRRTSLSVRRFQRHRGRTFVPGETISKITKKYALIRRAIEENDFLKNLMDEERLQAVVEAMSPQELTAGSFIIREGETGSHLYVSAEGQFQVIKGNTTVKDFGPGVAFGELAILYKAKRFASVKVSTNAKVWSLERRVFQKIIIRNGRQEQEDNIRFLSSVSVLQGIHPIELAKISDFLKREFYASGTAIVRQGDRGDKFYIIRGGTVSITKRGAGGKEVAVGELSRGDYFGEQALLHEDRRLATVTAHAPGVECLTLDRGPFTDLLGNLKELRDIRHTYPRISEFVVNKKVVLNTEYNHIQLKDLEIVGTLGVGGFGRVELVQYTKDRSKTFALKCLKKIEMVQQQQQEHAYNEKHIMIKCDNAFICRLYNTYKDTKYIYFLMEAVLGGDVWTILQKQRFFTDQVSRFIAGCVIEAFSYMHSHNMIYRDLKPENLMIDSDGYVKLVDFGFAKNVMSGSKTYTFAGTPEYVAPEIVLNKGHDRAADYWTLGIFIHELLVGKPPFRGSDHMKTYTLILKGIDNIQFHHRISKTAQILIKKLCRPVPTDRIGYLKNGINDIKNHKWYLGFDWDSLREKRMKAPLTRPVTSNTDLSNFDKHPKDKMPPDETSGWDADF